MTTKTRIDAIVEEITIAATADRVFAALTDPQQRVKWWGQRGRFETKHAESDLRPGGRWLMRGSGVGAGHSASVANIESSNRRVSLPSPGFRIGMRTQQRLWSVSIFMNTME